MSRPDDGRPADGGSAAQALFQELILDHYRRPRNRGELENADASVVMRNPLCGDELVVQLAVSDGLVRAAKFVGRGCSISQAAASMLTTIVRDKTSAQATELLERYTRLIHGDADAARDPALGDLRALGGVFRFPGRVKCALLSRDAIREGLARLAESQRSTVSSR
ncbi:MAG: SUF system NifU family Fe-S cluster assembly protein [Gemmatimonadaceae bacterium]